MGQHLLLNSVALETSIRSQKPETNLKEERSQELLYISLSLIVLYAYIVCLN